MTDTEKLEYFKNELDLIQNPEVRDFTAQALLFAPEYFWVNPSSSSGKYHPPQSQGIGGLRRHTRAVVYFSTIFIRAFDCEQWNDEIISAAILHDIMKYGLTAGAKHTVKDHAFMVTDVLKQTWKIKKIDKEVAKRIDSAIKFHMGRWSSPEDKRKPLDEYHIIELIVHLADMASSGKRTRIEGNDD